MDACESKGSLLRPGQHKGLFEPAHSDMLRNMGRGGGADSIRLVTRTERAQVRREQHPNMKPTEIRGDDKAFLRSRDPFDPTIGGKAVTLVDLFAGCGGLTLGVAEAARRLGRNLDIRLAIERDPHIAQIYRTNFQVRDEHLQSDVTEVFGGTIGRIASLREKQAKKQVGTLDLLVGGPPCQGHSTLNNHTRGDDPKNRLYMRMVRAAEILEPAMVIIENVPAVVQDSKGVVDQAAQALERLGYRVWTRVQSLSDLGVAQTRLRHVLVASSVGSVALESQLAAARFTKPRTLRWAIGDLEHCSRDALDTGSTLSPDNIRRARYLLSRNLFDLPNRMRPPCQRGIHKYKSMYGRLDWCEPAQTITTGFGSPGQGRYLHPSQLRTLTPHEAARIQFFPDWFDFSMVSRKHLSRAIGNAVPPKLSFVLALAVLEGRQARRPTIPQRKSA